jgi:DNA-binding NarL/FixJ family response regulator
MVEALSDRELQVFQLLGRGLNTKAIAGELEISPKTVDFYRESIKKKLGLPDGSAVIRHATLWQQEGRLPPE